MAELSLSEFQNLNQNQNQGRPRPPKKASPISSKQGLILGSVLLLVVGFLAGMQYQKSNTKTTPAATTASNQTGGFGSGGGFRRGNRAFGTVSAVSSSSITVQTRNGTSSTYSLTSSTTVTDNGQSASVSDIQTGDTVVLTLDSSNPKNVTAVMLNPSFGGGPGGVGNQNTGGSSSTDGSGASSGSANASGV